MTIEELKESCRSGKKVILVLPWLPGRGRGIRLCKTGGPIGKVLCVNSENQTVAEFNSEAVLKWIKKKKLDSAKKQQRTLNFKDSQMSRIRVGFVTPSLAMGGAERWMISLAKYSDPEEIEWVGTVVSSYAPIVKGITSEMVQLMPIFGTKDNKGDLSDLTICPSVTDAMERIKSKADVLITWGFHNVGSVTGPIDCPLVFVSHGACEWTADALGSSRSHCTHFAAVSHSAASVLDSDMHVIHNGIETDRCKLTESREEFRDKWGIKRNAIVLSYIGRYSHEKNPIAIAKAANEFDPGIVVAMYCGEGHKEQELREMVDREIGDQAVFVPFQPQVGNPLNASDIFVLASHTEGCSLALFEAWYAGVPTVATRVGAVPELEERFGELVSPVPVDPSPRDLAKAINKASTIEFRKTVVDRARQVVVDNFTAECMAEKWTDYLCSIVEEKEKPIVVPSKPEKHIASRTRRKRMAAVTCFFNPCGYSQPIENYYRFRQGLGSSIPLYTVELSYNGQFVIPGSIRIQANPETQTMFQKERLLNYGMSMLPNEFDAIAWLDSDILFTNSNWFAEAEKLLSEYRVVQLFESCHWLDQHGHVEKTRSSCASAGGFFGYGANHSHPGFAWAARRGTILGWDGLYDRDISGSGDAWMAHGFFQEFDTDLLRNSTPEMRASVLDWCQKVGSVSVSALPGDVLHLFHGKSENRNYWERFMDQTRWNFDPSKDIRKGSNCVWQWSTPKPDLHESVKRRFRSRLEDH